MEQATLPWHRYEAISSTVKEYERWQYTQLILDVAPGPSGNDFSLEGPDGYRFIMRSHTLSGIPG